MASAQLVSSTWRDRAELAQNATIFAVEADFNFRSSHFLRLFQKSSVTAFQHPLWLDAFYRLIAPSRGASKVVITGRDAQTGALRLVMPFVQRRTNGLTVIETADLGVSDHASPIYDRDWHQPDSIREEVAALLPQHDLLRIRPVRAETIDAWRGFIDGDTHSMDFFGPATALSGPFPEWRSGALGEAYRKPENPLAQRRLKCGASEMRLLTDSGQIANAIESIRRQRAGRFEADPLQEKPVQDFYTTLAVAGSGADFARTYAIIQDGKAIGHVFGISWKKRFHYLLIGCDFERHGRHTTSLILHDAMVQDWMGEDGAAFYFTVGDEAMRRETGDGQPAEMFIVTRAPTWRGRLARAAFDAHDHVERMQRGAYIG
jgi:CelD/BcsL family acetyltransferase involved in cellulose biosynthesis